MENDDKTFEKRIADGVDIITGEVKTIKSKQEQMLSDVDRLSAETKDALAGLEQVRENANEFAAQMTKVQQALVREERMSWGNPAQRFAASPERRNWLNGCLRKARGLPMTPEQRTTITGVDSGLGAAATPQETSDMIYDVLATYGQWNTLGQIPVGSRTQILPLMTARPTAYWVAQGVAPTEGAVTGSSVTLTIKEAAAWIPVADALLEDSETDMTAYVLDLLGQAVAYRLDWACFAADGTDDTTDGAFTGIAEGGTAAGAASGNVSVATLDSNDFVTCLTTVGTGVLNRPAKWWIHPSIIAKIANIKDSNGRPIFQNALEAPLGSIGSILGFPVIPTAAMPSTDSTSSVVAVFGDPMGCAVGVRKAFNFASSTDFEFSSSNTCFRAVVRAGVKIKAATAFAKLTTAAS